MAKQPSLKTELLFNLAFLAAAALLLGVGSVLLLSSFAPERAFPAILIIVALDVGIFIVFGRYIVTRHVLRPVARLIAAADAIAAGDLAARAPDAETADFATLAQRLNRMTDSLLDAQGQLVRSEKLASVGRLAAGVAHEIGNPLGAVGTYVDVLRRRGADPEVMTGLVRELERIDRIVRSLLDYARPKREALQPVAVDRVVRTAFELLHGQGALKTVQAQLDLAPDVPQVLGLAHELEQTLVNLVLNAVDAAPGGTVVVGARRWAYEPGHVPPHRAGDPVAAAFRRHAERRPSRVEFAPGVVGALLFVADSGPGVPAADRRTVFEPFYTTKAPGRGTGLGLAIVARSVEEMGGVVWVDGAREGGAAFKLFLPEVR
jgi:signal transduction histidine kinase